MIVPAVRACGLVTAVGLSAPASCAAIRAGVDGFTETRFMDKGGEWIIGCPVPLEEPWRGREKLIRLVAPAIAECLRAAPGLEPADIVLLLCLSEPDRPGRFADLDLSLIDDVAAFLKVTFHVNSGVVTGGRVGGVDALHATRDLLNNRRQACILAGVDTFLVAPTLRSFEDNYQLLTSQNSDGFIPGEAGAAVLITDAASTGKWLPAGPHLLCRGLGFAREKATVLSGEPLRGDGIASAVRDALSEAGLDMSQTDYRMTDTSGEQYRFKEAALAVLRVLRKRRETYEMWHPSDCIGEVGAATVPANLAVALAAVRKGYAPGPRVLGHVGNDGGERGAYVLEGVGVSDAVSSGAGRVWEAAL